MSARKRYIPDAGPVQLVHPDLVSEQPTVVGGGGGGVATTSSPPAAAPASLAPTPPTAEQVVAKQLKQAYGLIGANAFVRRYGVDLVLEAIQTLNELRESIGRDRTPEEQRYGIPLPTSTKVRNPAGYITWYCKTYAGDPK